MVVDGGKGRVWEGSYVPKRFTPPLDIQSAVKKLIADIGEDAAIDKLGLARQTVLRLAAGLSVNPTTLEVATRRLSQWGNVVLPVEPEPTKAKRSTKGRR